MALTIAVGFVVDDAIVMTEAIWRRIEHGETPFQAALNGAAEIGFTILTISISLIAVFTPLMFMGGVVGRLMREFALTLSAAVVLSVALSLTFTPMLCGQFLRPPQPPRNRFIKALETGFTRLEQSYARGLDTVMRHTFATLMVFIATAVLAGVLYVTSNTGFFPQQGHRLPAGRRGSRAGLLLRQHLRQVHAVLKILASDPDVTEAHFNTQSNASQTNINVELAPKDSGRKATADQIIARPAAQAGAGGGGPDHPAGQPGRLHRRARHAGGISVHPLRRRHKRAERMGPQAPGRGGQAAGTEGRHLRSAVLGRLHQYRDRPRRGRTVRHLAGGHRHGHIQHGRPAAGGAVLHPAERLSCGAGGPRPTCRSGRTCSPPCTSVAAHRPERTPVVARQDLHQRPGADRQPPGAVPVRHHLLQPGAGRGARPGDPGPAARARRPWAPRPR
ncbi:MAG: efflux RND transporter permease subunit [Caulobacteraceae bacterium]